MAPGLIRRVSGERPLYVEPSGRLWFSRGSRILSRRLESPEETLFGQWPSAWRDHVGMASRLAARALRAGLKGLLVLPDASVLLLARGRLLKARGPRESFQEVLRVQNGSGPLNVCLTPDGMLYFGEYFFNDRRGEVRIFGSQDYGESWSSVYTFPRGAVRHVHNIVYDPFRRGCWVTTGDSDPESMILFTGDGFRTLTTVFAGEQRYRTVSLIPLPDALLTGTDTPFEQNCIVRLFPESGRHEKVQDVSGSVFGMTTAGRFYVASVAVEPSKVNVSKEARLLISGDGIHWAELYRQAKDSWQIPYNRLLPEVISELPFFQHGTFEFPWGSAEVPVLHAYGQALVYDDNHLMVWDLETAAREVLE